MGQFPPVSGCGRSTLPPPPLAPSCCRCWRQGVTILVLSSPEVYLQTHSSQCSGITGDHSEHPSQRCDTLGTQRELQPSSVSHPFPSGEKNVTLHFCLQIFECVVGALATNELAVEAVCGAEFSPAGFFGGGLATLLPSNPPRGVTAKPAPTWSFVVVKSNVSPTGLWEGGRDVSAAEITPQLSLHF